MRTPNCPDVLYHSHAASQEMLVRMCEFESVSPSRIIGFVQYHFLEHRGLSTLLRMREPTVAFGLEDSRQLVSIAVRILVDS